ncbi:MAG: hypothetical protein NTX50_13770 [Candidatus Sumerlaeota bacterium]|nr:hypothetical protein [Candidatus Sumerlaeota bacterium]
MTSKDSAAKKAKEDEKDKLREVYKKVGKFIVCMTRDDKGCVWVGTEDEGVFRYDPEAASGKEWTQFTRVKTGGKAEPSTMGAVMREPGDSALGDDNAYAIACDKLGRIWVGTLNHGVSVYNGESWRTYDRLEGPLGERIFDIAICPTTGDVWIASSLGLARYSGIGNRDSGFGNGASGIVNRDSGFGNSASGAVIRNSGSQTPPSETRTTKHEAPTPNSEPGTRNYEPGAWRYYIRAAEASSLDKYPATLTARQTACLIECLPEDQCSSLAFDKDGNLYVGTQCHGLAIASAKDDYKSWRYVRAPERFGKDKTCSLPLDAEGDGLPSNLINQILVASDGVIWVGTTCGMAWSEDSGNRFRYLRGKDYAAKIKGLYGGAPKGWKEAPKHVMDTLIPEDYITCLAEDSDSRVWVGMRRAGFCIISPLSKKPLPNLDEKSYLAENYISVIQPMPDGLPFIASYQGGLARVLQSVVDFARKSNPLGGKSASLSPQSNNPKSEIRNPQARNPQAPSASLASRPSSIPFPAPATAPGVDAIAEMKERAGNLKAAMPCPYSEFLGEDWTTQGDWVRRYGWQCAVLCAMNSPYSHEWPSVDPYKIDPGLGPNHSKDDSVRNWVHWIKTDNPRSLYAPRIAIRRQAEWDDHGEAYPRMHEGPDIDLKVTVTTGVHRVSLYFFNKDGHSGENRMRDYIIEIKPAALNGEPNDNSLPLAHCRIHDFWGGVYKQFLVTGPARYQLRILKNNSLNTIVSAVLIDRCLGDTPHKEERHFDMAQVKYNPPDIPTTLVLSNAQPARQIRDLWNDLIALQDRKAISQYFVPFRSMAFRSAAGINAPQELLNNWKWNLLYWDPEQRQVFAAKMDEAWWNIQYWNPIMRTKAHKKYSPYTYESPDEWRVNAKRFFPAAGLLSPEFCDNFKRPKKN